MRERRSKEVREGFARKPKQLPVKFLYDERGAKLFDRITRLPEYTPTMAETRLLELHADELVEGVVELVELGAGFARKTELLLEALERQRGRRFVALDAAREALEAAIPRVRELHPKLEIEGVVQDFDRPFDLPDRIGKRLVAFLGSTIGNFKPSRQVGFLRRVRGLLGDGDRLLLGVDLVKDVERIEAAYDDSQGVSAAFALNMLEALNEEFGGNLPLDAFRYEAPFDREKSRIEMRLRATRDVVAHFDDLDLEVRFEEGEFLRTEFSHKFTRQSFESVLRDGGYELTEWRENEADGFALATARSAD